MLLNDDRRQVPIPTLISSSVTNDYAMILTREFGVPVATRSPDVMLVSRSRVIDSSITWHKVIVAHNIT